MRCLRTCHSAGVLGLTLFLVGPFLVLATVALIAAARRPRPSGTTVLGLVVASTAVWLVYVGLYPHEIPCNGTQATGCPTLYGYNAPLPDEHQAGWLFLLAGFAVPALWVGWRRLAPALATGALLALGPTVLAWWTAPRGDDGLWVLWFLSLPLLGGLAAAITAGAQLVGRAHARHDAA